jgi:hypothetical protein
LKDVEKMNGKCTKDVQKMYQRRLKDAGISRVLANFCMKKRVKITHPQFC